MLRLLIAFGLLFAAPTVAIAQQREAVAELWTRNGEQIALAAAHVSFPLRVGAVELTRTVEFSRHGQGLDNALQYVSQNQQIFATIYIYRPGLPHAGLTAFATEQAVRAQSGDELRQLGSRVVDAGGQSGIAIRKDYAGFRGGMASSAAFIKAGRWIVKLRVSGPDSRQEEVGATMSALLDGLRFDGGIRARPAVALEVADCPQSVAPAPALPGSYDQLLEIAMLSSLDGADQQPDEEQGNPGESLLGRVGNRWCQSTRARIGDASYAILRAEPAATDTGLGGRAVLVVPVNDSGATFELVEIDRGRRYVAFYHEIGRTSVLGSYGGPLSDEQVAAILSGADRDGNRVRASVDHLPNGNTNINMPPPPSDPATQSTTSPTASSR